MVAAAEDHPSAVEVAAFFRPEIALIDIGLSGIDGHDIARRVRRLPQCYRTYLVALGDPPSDTSAARPASFDAHLVKPVSTTTITALVADVQPRD